MKCCNENCKDDPNRHLDKICISMDGDFVCNEKCLKEFKNQMDYFCTHILTNDQRFEKYLNQFYKEENWVLQMINVLKNTLINLRRRIVFYK